MVRCIAKVLLLPINTLIYYAIFIFTIVQFFTFYGQYNYESVKRNEVKTLLYKGINKNIPFDAKLPECKYDYLMSTKMWNPGDIPKRFDNFSAVGVVNGSFYPKDCRPLFSVAILITYRNRQEQLDMIIPYLHNFLRQQNVHYKIYIIEQQDEEAWNKGTLYNIGARHAMADGFPCLILHDVDLLPLDDANIYACFQAPRHMSASIDKFRYVLTYPWIAGGVLSLRSEHYIQINGFSNKYQGWGAEDDDFSVRLSDEKLNIMRLPREMSRYTMLNHKPEKPNPNRRDTFASNKQHYKEDGYTSISYRSVRTSQHRLFTLIAVRL